MLIIIEIGKS